MVELLCEIALQSGEDTLRSGKQKQSYDSGDEHAQPEVFGVVTRPAGPPECAMETENADRDRICRIDLHRPGRQPESLDRVGDHMPRVNDRRRPHGEHHHNFCEVLDVAQVYIRRREKQTGGEAIYENHRDRREEPQQVRRLRERPEDGGGGEEDHQLDEEHETGSTDGGKREDLPWQVDLLHEAGVPDDRARGPEDHVAEEREESKTREQVNRELIDTLRCSEELAEHDVVHEELDDGPDDGPHETEETVAIPRLKISTYEEREQFAVPDDLAQLAARAVGPHTLFVDDDERLLRKTGESFVCVHGVTHSFQGGR